MYLMLDQNLKLAIKSVKKHVAKKFKVHHSQVDFLVCTDGNAGEPGELDVCFQCKTGYACLTMKDCHFNLLETLKGFAENKNVEWEADTGY